MIEKGERREKKVIRSMEWVIHSHHINMLSTMK